MNQIEISTEHILYLGGVLFAAIGTIWGFFVKVWWPTQQKREEREAVEAAKQREHEQKMGELEATEAAKQRELEATEAAKQREHERAIAQDKLEHEQGIELKERNAQVLQASWREDKMAELLEKDSSFIREEALKYLQNINVKVGQTEDHFGNLWGSQKELIARFDALITQEKARAGAFTLQNGILSDLLIEIRHQQTKISFIAEILKNENEVENPEKGE